MGNTNIFLRLSEDMFKKQPASAADTSKFGTSVLHSLGTVEILGFSCSIEQEGSEIAGKPRSVELVKPGAFTIKKAVDVRSPKLFFWCCNGEFISEANIECYGPDINAPPYLTYRLTYVHIASYEPSSDGGLPTETIKLKYGQMAVIFNDAGLGGETTHGNSKKGSVTTRWSWVMEMSQEMYAGQGINLPPAL